MVLVTNRGIILIQRDWCSSVTEERDRFIKAGDGCEQLVRYPFIRP